MADTKISALSAAAAGTGAQELAINDAGTSKKLTLAQLRTYVSPTVPTVVAVTAEFTSTGVPTATLPTGHTTNDILVLVLQSSNDSLVAAPSGYKQLGPQNGMNTGAVALANRLSIFWKRDGGSESAPTIPDTGDHTYGFMFAIRGCPTLVDPFDFGGNNFKFTASTTGTSPKSSTVVDNNLVIDIFAGNVDNASAEGSSVANADLTSVTEQFDDGTTDGTGGFLYMSSGIKAVAGDVGATTVTWANSSSDLCSRIHFLPSDIVGLGDGHGPTTEVQVFIGSPQDLDDTWVKPTGARKVVVQMCDGGGSGSSGHTVTTAAGGGGGGGGGYREKTFNASDLAATVTLHAGKGGAATTAAVDQAGNPGVISSFGVNLTPILLTGIAGTAATAAASADGGNGGCGSGDGLVSPAVATTRITLEGTTAGAALGGRGGAGGSGTTAPVGGSPAERGGGGGESGGDTDAATTNINNGYSLYGAGGGASGRTVQAAGSPGPSGGGGASKTYAAGANGNDSVILPYGGSGGCGGDSTTAPGGAGGFPGGGGGGGGGNNAGTQGGRGGHGCVVVTTYC